MLKRYANNQITNINLSVIGNEKQNVTPPNPEPTPPVEEGFERYVIGVIGPNIGDSVECEIAPNLFMELERKTIYRAPEYSPQYEDEGSEPTYDLSLKNTSEVVTYQGFYYNYHNATARINEATLTTDAIGLIGSGFNLRYNTINHLSLDINGELYEITYVFANDGGIIHISSRKLRNIG